MNKKRTALLLKLSAIPVLLLLTAGQSSKQIQAELIKRGEYLVSIGGCNDCHTPLKMGSNGPEPDWPRFLSGHPETAQLPPPPALPPGPWSALSAGLTAWSGPWGISYSANLTSDHDTGLGIWTESMFIQPMRTGKHFGASRPILPPMPWQSLAKATDEDLKAIFAYLRTVPPVKNHVPAPVGPGGNLAFE